MSRGSRRALVLGLALAVGTAVLVAWGHHAGLSFGVWLGSLLLVGLAMRDGGPKTHRPDSLDFMALALIVVLSAFLRFRWLDAMPSGLWKDEVDTVRNALNLATERLSPFGMTPLRSENWVKTSNLYLYFCWLVLAASGFSRLGVKLISVLPGVAAPPLLYVFARRFLPRPGATVAAGLLAASLWHLTLSRWGWDEVLVTALAVPLFAALWDASESASRRSYWLAGVLGGLSLYTYLSSRLLVAAALSFLVWRLLWLRSRRERLGLGFFLLGLGLAALPISIYWIHDPESFLTRIRELWYIGRVEGGWLGPLAHNAAAHLLMFHVAGDRNPRHNLPGLPMLDPVAGGLFLVGLAAAAPRWRRAESQIAFLWLFVGLLGGILSKPAEAPQAYRTGVVAPACYLLAGLGFEALRRAVAAGTRIPRFAVSGCVVALLGASSLRSYHLYFEARTQSPECWSSVGSGAPAESVRRAAQKAVASGKTVWLDKSVEWPALQLEIDRLRWKHPQGVAVHWVNARGLQPEELYGAVLLLTPDAWAQLPPAMRALPSRQLRSPFGAPVAIGVSAELAVLSIII